jgi:hypothetical protein
MESKGLAGKEALQPEQLEGRYSKNSAQPSAQIREQLALTGRLGPWTHGSPWFSVTEAELNTFNHHDCNVSHTRRIRVSGLKGLCTKTTPGYNPQ